MFASPKWEQDVTDLDVKFEKKIKRKKQKNETVKYKEHETSYKQSNYTKRDSNTSLGSNSLTNTPNKSVKIQKLKRKHNDFDEKTSSQEKRLEGELKPSMKKLKSMATTAIQKIKNRKRKTSNVSVGISGKKRKLKNKKMEMDSTDQTDQNTNNIADGSPYSDNNAVNVPDDSDEMNITVAPQPDANSKSINKGNVKKQLQRKETLKQLLQHNTRTHLVSKETNLRTRMLQKLKAAQFRYLNERLYTSTGDEAQKLFAQDPSAFQAYHSGYQYQIAKWPINPLECIIKRINKMPNNLLIADMGCGDATLSKRVAQKVRSFELVVSAPGVEACNMAHTPLGSASMDVVVYCLALMGINLTDFLLEANRVLRMGGQMMIAEVESRFESTDTFISEVQRLGFKLSKLDKTHKMFVFLDFKKVQDPPAKKGKLPKITLKPCLYKKR